ncbi:dienelactone hydrolase family protein [Roseomonas sp. HF4]|uniref:dienelactone hydrolase family protein n=1 Tax=Roseomonas sp. HF4 TaxID=2562313 RepID=UPI0010C0ECC6|nr:dienelactone hydrolase family protein [Roseomonas sp. HF4]
MRALTLLLAFLLAACGGGPRPDVFTYVGSGNQPMAAELWLPEGTGRVPVVILSHDVRGKRDPHLTDYVNALKGSGAAVLVLDHYASRSIDTSRPPPERAWITAMDFAIDAYGALEALAEHPRIDRRRAGLVGFGEGGGGGALLAAHQWLIAQRPANGPRFLAFAAVAPECAYRLGNRATNRAPILMLVAERDNRTGRAPCDDLASYLRAAGGNVTVNLYRGARHGFDDPAGPVRADPQGENITRCVWQQGPDGLWRERASGVTGASLFRINQTEASQQAYLQSRQACRTLGTETQGDAALRGRAVGEVAGHMKTHVIDARVR